MADTRSKLAILALSTSIFTAFAAHADNKLTIGISLPNAQGAWHTAVIYGITDEAKKQNVDAVILDSAGYANVARQLDQIASLMVRKASAILIEPTDPAALNGAVEQLKTAGIYVVGTGVNVVATDVPVDAAASSSHCTLGTKLAEDAIRLLPHGGKIGMLAGPAGASWASERDRCFKDGIAGHGFEIVAERYSEQDPSATLSLASDIVQRFPSIDLLYGADDVYGVGAARAVREAGRCGEIKVIFGLLGEEAEEMMRAGCVDRIEAMQPVTIGRVALRQAITLAKGGAVDPKIEDIGMTSVSPDMLDSLDRSTFSAPAGWKP